MLMKILPENKNMFTYMDTAAPGPEVIKGEGIVLLSYIYRDSNFKQQAKVLNDLSKVMKNIIQVFIIDEDEVQQYNEFDINGSPTFILLYNGEEKGRLLGKSDIKSLTDFISNHLLEMI